MNTKYFILQCMIPEATLPAPAAMQNYQRWRRHFQANVPGEREFPWDEPYYLSPD